MRVLVVGDPHLKIGILAEATSFIDQLIALVRANSYDYVILLGDLFDSFAVVRSEILSLWTRFFRAFEGSHTKLIALVGNHDMAGAEGGTNPMEAFKAYPNVMVVDEMYVGPNYLGLGVPISFSRSVFAIFVPFFRHKEEFEHRVREINPGSILFCHQSFNGAQFENGFYDPEGADPSSVSHLAAVISGHVHKRQSLGNIWYPGTPFQHSFGDAGEEKRIYELDLHENGYTIVKEIELKMPTFNVVTCETVAELQEALPLISRDPMKHFKLIAQGTPSEIQAFWQDPAVRQFKEESKRLVDGLTSLKPTQSLPGINATTPQARLQEFIHGKQWRTNSERLARRAEELLAP